MGSACTNPSVSIARASVVGGNRLRATANRRMSSSVVDSFVRTAMRPTTRIQFTVPSAARMNSIDWPRSGPSVTTARSGPKNAIGISGRGSPVFGTLLHERAAPPSARTTTAFIGRR